jgi:hypothetical protein
MLSDGTIAYLVGKLEVLRRSATASSRVSA